MSNNPLFGVDVSAFQGRPNWRTAARSGITFAIAKATEGRTFTDPAYAHNREQIRAAGLVPGAYHYLTATSSAASQADHFCAVADPQAIHALDVEANAHLDVAGWVIRYRAHHPHHPLVIYTGRDLWARAGQVRGAQYGPLWVAGYQPNAYVAGTGPLASLWAKVGAHRGGLPWAGWTAPTLMQFTDRGQVPGITGPVDGDAFLGSPADLHALASQQPHTDQEDDMPTAREVADAILDTPVPTGELGSDGHPLTYRWMLIRTYQGTERLEAKVAELEQQLTTHPSA